MSVPSGNSDQNAAPYSGATPQCAGARFRRGLKCVQYASADRRFHRTCPRMPAYSFLICRRGSISATTQDHDLCRQAQPSWRSPRQLRNAAVPIVARRTYNDPVFRHYVFARDKLTPSKRIPLSSCIMSPICMRVGPQNLESRQRSMKSVNHSSATVRWLPCSLCRRPYKAEVLLQCLAFALPNTAERCASRTASA